MDKVTNGHERPSTSTPRNLLKRNGNTGPHKDALVTVHRNTILIVKKSGINSHSPSAGEGINKMCSVHTTKYDLANKRDHMLTHPTLWMNLKTMTCYVKETGPKEHTLHDSIYVKRPEKANQ